MCIRDRCGDLIGHNGSYCPFLLPLPPLIEHKVFLLHGMFDNGDGVMIFFPNKKDNSDLHLVRVLLTDSGHYLLPTDSPDSQAAEEGALADTVIDAFENVVRSLRALTGRGSSRSSTPNKSCLLYTSPSPRDGLLSRMPSSA